jgi:D-lyxose ketol-isomerase
VRGWDFIEIEDLMLGMLGSAREWLRKEGRVLQEPKAAYHAACVRDLASEASKVLDGTMGWSRQDYMGFCKELDWELQAFSKANT